MARLLGFSLLLMTAISSLDAAVYHGDAFIFHQPDGSEFRVLLWGDEFSIQAETPDGWTVTQGVDRWWTFAQPLAGGGIQPSALRVGAGDPATLGVVRHLRASQSQRAAVDATQRVLLHRDARGLTDSPILRQARAARQAADPSVSGSPSAAPGGPQPAPGVRTTGTRRGVTLMIRFPDHPGDATIAQAAVNSFCNGDGYTGFGNNGSVKQYFLDNSLGRLTYTSDVIDYYTASHDRSYYTDPGQPLGVRAQELIKEALGAADAKGFNFSACDANHDGVIDAVNAFYAGTRVNNWNEGLWPHQSSITWTSNDGVHTGSYQITDMGSSLQLGTFCHENGHMLCDFPDLYDYDTGSGASEGGAGVFCLMNFGGSGAFSANPVRICGYLALAAGWRDPVDLAEAVGTQDCVAESASIFRYRKPGILTEYFLIENRNRNSASGRDRGLPCSGLAIWHCDELGDHSDQSYAKNSAHHNYECALVQADSRHDFENNANDGDVQDLWYQGNSAPGYTNRFEDGDGSNPTANDARWWSGTASQLLVTSISAPGPTMSFTSAATTLSLASTTYTVAEGNGGITDAIISVIRTGSTVGSVSAAWTLSDGSATLADLDYPAQSGTITWANGVGGTKTFTVKINADTKSEGDESFQIHIASLAAGITMGQTTATLTITNDDTIPPGGSLEPISYAASVAEGTGGGLTPVNILVRRRGGNAGAVSVPWSTAPGTATADVDYVSASGTVNWADGDTANKTITVQVRADSLPEDDETFQVMLGTATGGAIAPTPNIVTVTILNDDYSVSLLGSRIRLSRPHSGTVGMPVYVQHVGSIHGTFSVHYHLVADGTATAAEDFTMIPPGTLTWAASSASDPYIMVPIVAAGRTQGIKTLSVVLENPVGTELGSPNTATIEIADFDVSQYTGGSAGDAGQTTDAAAGGGCGAGAGAMLLGLGLVGVGLGSRRRRQR